PRRWRFRFDNEEVSLGGLSWPQVAEVFHETSAGEFEGQSQGEYVYLEFNATRAAVLYRGRDGVYLRPYFPRQPAADQDLGPFYCDGCGIRLGDPDEYLARFLLSREEGLCLFAAVLAGPPLPSELPDLHEGQPVLPGFEEWVVAWTAGQA